MLLEAARRSSVRWQAEQFRSGRLRRSVEMCRLAAYRLGVRVDSGRYFVV